MSIDLTPDIVWAVTSLNAVTAAADDEAVLSTPCTIVTAEKDSV